MNALLHQFTHSETAGALSLVLVHSLWQGVVVAVALAVTLHMMHRATPRARYIISCFSLLALMAWPVFTFCQLTSEKVNVVETPWTQQSAIGDEVQVRRQTSDLATSPVARPLALTPGSPAVSQESPMNWQGCTLLFWLTGMTLLSCWHLLGWVGLQRLRHRGSTVVSGELASTAARLAKRMRLNCRVRVCWSAHVVGAISFGWLRPVVLLPAAMATGFSMRELEMILAHEFAHLRRHDYLVNLLQSAVETLLFYHPAVWWVSRQIRREREHACDDIAVQATGDAVVYARALVRLAESAATFTPSLPRLAMAAGKQSGLRRRIERLLRPEPSTTSLLLRPASGLAMLVLVMLVIGAPDAASPLQAEERTELGTRGTIRDRNGVPLAISDRPDRQITFNLEKVIAAWRAVPGREVPMRTYARPKEGGGTQDVMEPDMVYIFDELITPVLESHQLAHPYNANAMGRHYREHRGATPFVYTKDLTEEAAKRVVALKGKIQGMDTRTIYLRHYPFKAMAAHVLGYTIDSGSGDSEYGASGLEKAMQSALTRLGADGVPKNGATRGGDVYLTLDARHQYIAERSLRDSQPAIGRGAVVLLDVSSGDVLAMASAPSYDPNDFIPAISTERFEEYTKDSTNPLLNRAVRSFVPGATFLVATSLAGICDGKEGFQHTCTGGSTFGNKYMQCWMAQKGGAHGPLDLRGGLAGSCNPYFYNLGNAINPDKYDAVVALLGFGQDLGIGLSENDRGIFPNRAWWEKHRPREPYTAATVANLSIGQGALQASPLQLASLLVPVANGGQVWRPRLVDRIAPSGDISSEEKRPRQLAGNLRDQGLTDTGLETLRSAMRTTVTEGTAQMANLPELPIAGRTGTAQNWRSADGVSMKDNHTLFIAYAPVDNPKWAICVLVQGGKGGGVSAAPIAARILKQVAEVEAGKRTIEPQTLEPIKGSFDPVEVVEYPPISK